MEVRDELNGGDGHRSSECNPAEPYCFHNIALILSGR